MDWESGGEEQYLLRDGLLCALPALEAPAESALYHPLGQRGKLGLGDVK